MEGESRENEDCMQGFSLQKQGDNAVVVHARVYIRHTTV